MLTTDPGWEQTAPGAAFGILTTYGVRNPASHPIVSAAADHLERDLRERFGQAGRDALRATEPLPAYAAWYRRFGQRYHVMMQMESVALKGKPLPRSSALVEAMFVVELRYGMLLAAHDLGALRLPVTLGVGDGNTAYRTLAGQPATVKHGDLYARDADGVLSSIVAGPSDRGRITPETTSALICAYAPPGVGETRLNAALDEMADLLRALAPGEMSVARFLVAAPNATVESGER